MNLHKILSAPKNDPLEDIILSHAKDVTAKYTRQPGSTDGRAPVCSRVEGPSDPRQTICALNQIWASTEINFYFQE